MLSYVRTSSRIVPAVATLTVAIQIYVLVLRSVHTSQKIGTLTCYYVLRNLW